MPNACATSEGISTPVNRRGMAKPSSQSARRTRTGDQLFDLRQDTRHNDVDAGGVRVLAIALVELEIGGHTVKEGGIKNDRMSRGKCRIDRIEGGDIIGTQ